MVIFLSETEAEEIRRAINARVSYCEEAKRKGGPMDPQDMERRIAICNEVLNKLEEVKQ